MDIFSTYAVDEAKEQNGTWMELGDAEFLVARAGNKAYRKQLGKTYERNKKALETKTDAADELSDKIMIDVIADTILFGWKNVSFKGKELEFSKDNAKMLLGFKDFRTEIMKLAEDFDAFKAEQQAEDLKN